jgi:protein O-GlcNAc transferase
MMKNLQIRLINAFKQQNWWVLSDLCKKQLVIDKKNLLAHRYLGFSLHKLHQENQAIQAFNEAILRHPNDLEIKLNYANTLMAYGSYFDAIPLLEIICKHKKNAFSPWVLLSHSLYLTQHSRKGIECAIHLQEIAKTDQEKSVALRQKALHRRELGEISEAIVDCQNAIKLDPTEAANYTNKLLFMLADPEYKVKSIKDAADEFAVQFELPIKHLWTQHDRTSLKPWKKLNIGFLSPDFKSHSVMYFLEGLLASLDRHQFNIIAFHLHTGCDLVTERVKNHVDVFVNLNNHSYLEQIDLITAQQPDIIIDVAGHTGNNGLYLMARKLAPIQVSWLGYPATTGLTAIDYKITDEVTDPPDADTDYSENLYRLNTLFCCYRPHIRNPLWRYQPAFLVQPTPALSNGYVTFGSCNNLGKLTDNVLRLWGQLLHEIPNARLLIEGKNLDEGEFGNKYQARCESLGIPLNRLKLVPLNSNNQYLTYHRIDIALDPFPLTGGTTTFDLLWMGLPLVSMQGDSFKSRLSTGILTYLDRKQWLANSNEEYIGIAKKLAADIDALNASRLAQRAQIEDSPLMNERHYTKLFGQALREMWLRWLAQGPHPDDPVRQTQQIEQWHSEIPASLQMHTQPEVGVATGKRLSLSQTHQKLQQLLEQAKTLSPDTAQGSGQINDQSWRDVTEFAETVLSAIPHEPLALACLAEVEHAHGHTDFAMTYLRYATESMSK